MAYQPKSYRKFLAGTVTAAVVASAVAPAASAAFPDVPADNTHAENIDKAVEMGLINGYPDGTFGVDKDITRGQVAKIIARYLGEVDTTGVEQFKDVDASKDPELAAAALAVRAEGVFTGSNGALNPDKSISRQEMASVLVRLFGFEDLADKESDVTDNDKAYEVHRANINILSENGITTVSEFNPLNNVKRGQFASFMVRSVEATTPAVELPAISIESEDSTHLLVTIEGDYPELTAEDFVFDGDLEVKEAALVTEAAAEGDEEAATSTYRLTTSEQEAGKTYNLVEFMGYEVEEGTVAPVVVPATPEISSVSAITNTKIQVSFKEAVKAVSKESFTVEGLTVESVTLAEDGKSAVIVTSAQTAGKLYTLKSGETTATWVALPVDAVKPAISTVTAVTNTLVQVTFEQTDATAESVLNPANYTFDNGLTASDVQYVVDANGKKELDKVYVTTSAQTAGTVYKLTVKNVEDASGNKVDSDKSFQFAGKSADKSAPTLAAATSKKGNKVELTFNDASQLDVAAISNVSNYTIAGLTVTGVEVDSNPITAGNKKVILTTSNQAPGTVYKVVAKNIKDVYGNVPTSDLEAQFAGTSLDTTPPSVSSAVSRTNTKVAVTFNDDLDVSSLNVANFTIDGLTVVSAEFDKDANGKDDKDVVILTTSAQTAGNVYKVKVANVKDEAGNAITSSQTTEAQFAGKSADTAKPTVSSVTAEAGHKVKIVFADASALDEASVKTLTNYSFDGGLGYPTSATYDKASKTVTLTTAKQEAGKVYNVTINNVKDEAGNVIATDTKKAFAGIGDALAAPALDSVVALNAKQIKVTFNKNVTDVETGDFALTKGGAPVNTISSVHSVDGKTYIITLSANLEQAVYKLAVSGGDGIKDLGGTLLDTSDAKVAERTFGGVDTVAAGPALQAVTQVAPDKLELVFDTELSFTDGSTATFDNTDITLDWDASGVDTYATTAVLDSSKKKVTVTLNASIPADKVVKLVINDLAEIKDVTGTFQLKATNSANDKVETSFGSVSFASTAVKVTSAVSVDEQTLEVQFNQSIDLDETQKAAILAGLKVTGQAITFKDIEQTDSNKVRIYFNGASFTEGTIYELDLSHADVKNNLDSVLGNAWSGTANDAKVSFGYNASENPAPYLVSATPISKDTIQLTFSEGVTGFNAIDDLKITSVATPGGITVAAPVAVGTDGKTYTVKVTDAVFATGITYTVQALSTAGATDVLDLNGVDALKDTKSDGSALTVSFGGIGTVTVATAAESTGDIAVTVPSNYTYKYRVAATQAALAGAYTASTTTALAKGAFTASSTEFVEIIAIDAAGNEGAAVVYEVVKGATNITTVTKK